VIATSDDVFERIVALQRERVPFALATVVRSRKPASGRPGDRAVILADGSMQGWVGGSCAQPTIRREALRALADGKPRLVRLSPDVVQDGLDSEEGVVAYTMTCHSGGSLEVYVEPFSPPSRLFVIGASPVARSLLTLGAQLGFDTAGGANVAAPATPDTWVVIASMGDGDELATEGALRSGAGYVALVASRRRAGGVLDYLRQCGLGGDVLSRLKAPAGLDIGAAAPAEIALSILAEIISERRKRREIQPVASSTSIDPVCGMEVDIATARWTTDFEGQTVRFCAPGCRRSFLADPTRFTPAMRS
jgi:xanthine dehydrogenase accessory factor